MAVFSIVKLSELEGAKRIDAEYYKPEYLEIIDILTTQKAKLLIKLVTDIICGPFGSSILERDYRPNGIPLIRVSDTADLFIKDDDLVFIDDSLSEKMKRYQVFPGDLVVSQRGTIAMFSLVTQKFPKWNISANLISIKKSNKINFNYLLIFLNSFYGASQLFRKQSGEVQPKITTDDVKQLLVFVASPDIQEKVSDLVELAYKEKEISYSLYSQAENLLLEELGLKDFKPRYEKTYTANLSDAFSAHRIDAEYFQPAYEEVIEKIKNYKNGFVSLLKSVENVKPDFDPTKYPDKIFSYVELADIDSSIGVIHSVNEIRGEEAPSRARRMLREGDVIVSSVEGSLEKVALVDKEHDGCLASTGFFQFRPLDILPEVLLVLSKTIVLQSQLKKRCSGTILTAVPKESLRDIIIPILPLSTQQKIASLVQQSHEARKRAKELIEIAKRAVEIAIEKNEEEAKREIEEAIEEEIK